jgi:TonB family protein
MRDRKTNHSAFATSITGILVFAALQAFAVPEESFGVTHFIDTSTDRVPALTAFPKYPSVARRDRIEGEATVCFKIKADGRVSRPVVTEYTHKIFSKPALSAIKKSNFEPIGPGQILATARTCRTYRFRLDPVAVDNDEPE